MSKNNYFKVKDVGLKFNGAFTYGNIPNKIVLYNANASTCTIEEINEWHKNNGWIGCSYHFLVRKDGTIYKGRPENVIGAHCQGSNTGSLGICFEGNYMIETMPQVQCNAGIELIRYLLNEYGTLAIFGHMELYNTECPGTKFPLGDFKNIKISNEIGWIKEGTVWWYRNSDGSYPKDCWQEIKSECYSFDSQGYARQSTWLKDNGYWYYLQDN